MFYVKCVSEWQWFIGAGFWFDDVNMVIEQKREELIQSVRKYMAMIALTMNKELYTCMLI